MPNQPYNIRLAKYSFTCPIAGIQVRKGDEYIEIEGVAISMKAGLPERRLKPIGIRAAHAASQ